MGNFCDDLRKTIKDELGDGYNLEFYEDEFEFGLLTPTGFMFTGKNNDLNTAIVQLVGMLCREVKEVGSP